MLIIGIAIQILIGQVIFLESISRREFFSIKVLGDLWNKTLPAKIPPEGLTENHLNPMDEKSDLPTESERVVMQDYFSSPLYSYALLSEMPWEMLIDEAQKRGIPHEGRSKMEVVRELFTGEKDGG